MKLQLTHRYDSNYNDLLESIFNVFDFFIRIPKYFLGIIGLILVMPIITVISSFLYVVIYYQKRSFKKFVNIMYDKVDEIDDKELINMHLTFENLRLQFQNAIRKSQNI